MSYRMYQRFCVMCGTPFETGRIDAKYCRKSTCRWHAWMERKQPPVCKSAADMKAGRYQTASQAPRLVTKSRPTASQVLVTCLCGCNETFFADRAKTGRTMYKNGAHRQRAYRARLEARGPRPRKQYEVLPGAAQSGGQIGPR